MFDNSLKDSLIECAVLVQSHMNKVLQQEYANSKILEAMRYSALMEGKRIRPFLLMAAAKIFDVDVKYSLNAAVAMELVHCYSLIHDDLPSMDNDDFRRGKPSCHKKFNEATAILAGDALLTYAFELLSDEKTHENSQIRCKLIKILAQSSGFKGMVGGQMMDLEKANQEITKEELAALHRLKTGELFMASAQMGAVLGGATEEEIKSLKYYAHDLGLAFQIKDDILDYSGVKVGKIEIDETEQDICQDNASVVDVVGIDTAIKQLKMLKEQAIIHLKPFGEKAKILVDLTEFVISRQN